MYNKEQTSKLISYWLRHNPSDGGLTMDDFGWVYIHALLHALKSKGQELSYFDIQELNMSFDKIRWEFNSAEDKLRATHGHSIAVILQEKQANPPEVLYHGTAVAKLPHILKSGLLPMQRQFVHLSANFETAMEVGKRHGLPIVIEVDAESHHKTGASFFQTSDNVWLATQIPVEILSIKPWETVNDKEKVDLLKELKIEVDNERLLHNKVSCLELILRRYDCDECLFMDNSDNKIYLVHLTWQGKQDLHSDFPETKVYESFSKWIEEELTVDQRNWYII